jgi:hypothetical protein
LFVSNHAPVRGRRIYSIAPLIFWILVLVTLKEYLILIPWSTHLFWGLFVITCKVVCSFLCDEDNEGHYCVGAYVHVAYKRS